MLTSRYRFWIFFAVFTIGFLVLAFSIAEDFGLSWDEPMRWTSGDQKLAYYEEFFASDEKFDIMASARRDVYPGLYDLPLAYARKNMAVSPFVLSRIWNVFWSALGLVGVVLLMRRLIVWDDLWLKLGETKSKTLERDLLPFLPAVVLLCSPEFFTHLFINPKDMPFATTYTWGVLALVCFMRKDPGWREWLFLGLSAGTAIAIRPPGVIIIAYYGLYSLLFIAIRYANDKENGFVKPIVGLARGSIGLAVLALAFAFPWWPALHRNPFTATGSAVGRLHSFASSKPVLFQGEFYDAGEIPIHYAIWMLLAKIPEWFALLLIGSFFIAFLRRKELIDRLRCLDRRSWGVAIVGFAFIFPVAYVTLSRAAIHNGYRHMLYTLPVAAVLAAFAWRHLYKLTYGDSRKRMLLIGASVVFALFSVFNLYRLHPYQYVYYNAMAGGTAGAYGSYETEYWFTSGKEAAEFLNEFVESELGSRMGSCVFVMGPVDTVKPFLKSPHEITLRLEEADYYVGRMTNADFMQGSRLLYSIERAGLPILVVAALNVEDRI